MSSGAFDYSEPGRYEEVILVPYDLGQSSFDKSNVIELFPCSFLRESAQLHKESSRRQNFVTEREASRRMAFLRDCLSIDYCIPDEPEPNVDEEAAINSEKAWERKYEFSDGSILGEDEITFVEEETKEVLHEKDHKAEYTQEDIEQYQKKLRAKYELERAQYRLELEALSRLEHSDTERSTDFVIRTREVEISQAVADELKELFEEHDIFEPVRKAEIERIKREERKEKLKEILNFLSQGLEEE